MRFESTITVEGDGAITSERILAGEKGELRDFYLQATGMADNNVPPLHNSALCGFLNDEFDTVAAPMVVGQSRLDDLDTYDDDGRCGVRVGKKYDASLDQSSAVSEILRGPARLYKDAEQWKFSATVQGHQAFVADSAKTYRETGELLPATDFGPELEWIITIDLPGKPIEGQHNADSVDGGRFSWTVTEQDRGRLLFAQTEPQPFSVSPATGVAIGAIVVGVGTLARFFLRDDTEQQPAWLQAAEAESSNRDQATPAPVRAPSAEPFYDAALGAWLIDDPGRGRLRHDPAKDVWVAAAPAG